ncbi:MAG TPA: FtsX-like permease family protein, partial [Thermoplasmata archaeon]|nr:FtsX-like permease family protein [Thermoplasmata archaeon]
GREAIVIAFDLPTYSRIVNVPPSFWVQGSLASAANASQVILSVALAQQVGAPPGSMVSVAPGPPLGTGSTSMALPVSAVARSLPGLYAYGADVPAIAYVPLSLLRLNLSAVSYSRFLVEPVPGRTSETAAALSALFSWRATVVTPSAAQQDYVDTAFADITLAFLSVETWTLVGLAIAGVATVVTLQLVARRRVYANMACRGMSRRQMLSFLLIQATYIYAIAYAIGAVTGFIAGFGFTQALMNSNPTARFFVPAAIDPSGWFFIGLPATLLLLTAGMDAFYASKIVRGARAHFSEAVS